MRGLSSAPRPEWDPRRRPAASRKTPIPAQRRDLRTALTPEPPQSRPSAVNSPLPVRVPKPRAPRPCALAVASPSGGCAAALSSRPRPPGKLRKPPSSSSRRHQVAPHKRRVDAPEPEAQAHYRRRGARPPPGGVQEYSPRLFHGSVRASTGTACISPPGCPWPVWVRGPVHPPLSSVGGKVRDVSHEPRVLRIHCVLGAAARARGAAAACPGLGAPGLRGSGTSVGCWDSDVAADHDFLFKRVK